MIAVRNNTRQQLHDKSPELGADVKRRSHLKDYTKGRDEEMEFTFRRSGSRWSKQREPGSWETWSWFWMKSKRYGVRRLGYYEKPQKVHLQVGGILWWCRWLPSCSRFSAAESTMRKGQFFLRWRRKGHGRTNPNREGKGYRAAALALQKTWGRRAGSVGDLFYLLAFLLNRAWLLGRVASRCRFIPLDCFELAVAGDSPTVLL